MSEEHVSFYRQTIGGGVASEALISVEQSVTKIENADMEVVEDGNVKRETEEAAEDVEFIENVCDDSSPFLLLCNKCKVSVSVCFFCILHLVRVTHLSASVAISRCCVNTN